MTTVLTTPPMYLDNLKQLALTSTPESFTGLLKKWGNTTWDSKTGFKIISDCIRTCEPDHVNYHAIKTQILDQYEGRQGPFAGAANKTEAELLANMADITAENEALKKRVKELEAALAQSAETSKPAEDKAPVAAAAATEVKKPAVVPVSEASDGLRRLEKRRMSGLGGYGT